MIHKTSISRKTFLFFCYLILALLALTCVLPMIHVLSISLSKSSAAMSGHVKLLPVGFTLRSYGFIAGRKEFVMSFFVSIKRVLLGVPINMLMTILVAYPLSKEVRHFRGRNILVWFFMVTMLFSGGLIPTYLVVSQLKMVNTIWALVIPGAVPIFNVILLLNFFRQLPKELEEAAFIDGAGHLTTLWKIFLPLSKPALATIALFVIVGHWNAWFDGLIYMNSTENYPLQSYLHTTIINYDTRMITERDLQLLQFVNDRTSRAAEIFIAMVPILLVYPFLQRYFTTGIVLGSVKG